MCSSSFANAGQVAITGAASGMGLATAQLLATKGAIISLADINKEALNNAVKILESSDKHMITAVDVRDGDAVKAWIDGTIAKYGKLDGAVNMAGIITHATPVVDTTDDDWDRTFDVNVKGVFNCLRAQLKVMSNGGSIVSTSPFSTMTRLFIDHMLYQVSAASVFGQFGAPGNSAYCASKAAVIGLSRTAAKENEFIRVNCVSPGRQPPSSQPRLNIFRGIRAETVSRIG